MSTTRPRKNVPHHILIVDDQDEPRHALRALLEDQNLQVTACASAADALAHMRSPTPYDLVITDVVMPGMDGVELAREVRRVRPDLRVVLVTGHDSAMDHLINAGSIALLKPYSAQSLARVLDEELRRLR